MTTETRGAKGKEASAEGAIERLFERGYAWMERAEKAEAEVSRLTAELEATRAALTDLVTTGDRAMEIVESNRKRGDFDHWQSFDMGDFGAALESARALSRKEKP